jgi:hypothetical protein
MSFDSFHPGLFPLVDARETRENFYGFEFGSLLEVPRRQEMRVSKILLLAAGALTLVVGLGSIGSNRHSIDR